MIRFLAGNLRQLTYAALLASLVLTGFLWWLTASRLEVVTGERNVARVERDQVLDVVTELTVPANAKGERVRLSTTDALAAARGLGREVTSRRANDRETTRRTRETVVRSDTADRALADVQRANVRRAERVAPVIRRLQNTKVAETAEEAARAIDEASLLPWKGATE